MNSENTTAGMDMQVKLSTLWIFVMFNMAFADILSFMLPGFFEEAAEMQVTQVFMLVAAIFVEIPIAMIVLSRVLNYSVNRWVNIIAAVITILFVIAGGSTSLHYIFFATIEVAGMLLIIWYAWRWPNPEA